MPVTVDWKVYNDTIVSVYAYEKFRGKLPVRFYYGDNQDKLILYEKGQFIVPAATSLTEPDALRLGEFIAQKELAEDHKYLIHLKESPKVLYDYTTGQVVDNVYLSYVPPAKYVGEKAIILDRESKLFLLDVRRIDGLLIANEINEMITDGIVFQTILETIIAANKKMYPKIRLPEYDEQKLVDICEPRGKLQIPEAQLDTLLDLAVDIDSKEGSLFRPSSAQKRKNKKKKEEPDITLFDALISNPRPKVDRSTPLFVNVHYPNFEITQAYLNPKGEIFIKVQRQNESEEEGFDFGNFLSQKYVLETIGKDKVFLLPDGKTKFVA